jgi:hypothetical protein
MIPVQWSIRQKIQPPSQISEKSHHPEQDSKQNTVFLPEEQRIMKTSATSIYNTQGNGPYHILYEPCRKQMDSAKQLCRLPYT